jgi:hypothetical protein
MWRRIKRHSSWWICKNCTDGRTDRQQAPWGMCSFDTLRLPGDRLPLIWLGSQETKPSYRVMLVWRMANSRVQWSVDSGDGGCVDNVTVCLPACLFAAESLNCSTNSVFLGWDFVYSLNIPPLLSGASLVQLTADRVQSAWSLGYRLYFLGIVFRIPGGVRNMFFATRSLRFSKCTVRCCIECTVVPRVSSHIANQLHVSVVLTTMFRLSPKVSVKHTVNSQYSETNVIHFLFILFRINASACFEHCLLILRRRLTSCTWCIALCYVSWLHQGAVLRSQ